MAHTVMDFWRMIWLEKCPIIVMITKLSEKTKVSLDDNFVIKKFYYRLIRISTYINTKMFVCLSVCLFVHVFLGHFETDWDIIWYKDACCFGKGSKTIIFNKVFLKSYYPVSSFL